MYVQLLFCPLVAAKLNFHTDREAAVPSLVRYGKMNVYWMYEYIHKKHLPKRLKEKL